MFNNIIIKSSKGDNKNVEQNYKHNLEHDDYCSDCRNYRINDFGRCRTCT